MNKILGARTDIYDWFQSSTNMQSHFSQAALGDEYGAYYTSMYLIQDTAESVSCICNNGFSSCPLGAYLELWGTLQALIIQQDAIGELKKAITKQVLPRQAATSAWTKIRTVRNEISGHPAAQGNNSQPKRSFVGRNFGVLNQIAYEQYQSGSNPNGTRPNTLQLTIDLRALIDQYDTEADKVLQCVLAHMKTTWP